ncbi:PhzF family phenazine biosynthesis protein [Caldanaerobacter subterraneus subsp. tengcongensis MB4]|uniref:Predicted epimerase, PhzC/PhzF homolog n=2 Tax=Caldanaerobacter subterraneus TaxID=911092 RepID=Q8RBT0_CALS4|nr:PhzF family phenazine biosynthesis protein [Caldanaerobacter subterraneus]AAM23991.1 predicted epimerase, PhzC/PhzF homolog [Caldanaerobacter subterraneus subsp. tengcongensis MB4]MCS3916489.1 PhzF family phenazine biosynthesis protein [Caldanaerobacter subterraneus subsp. tengcongensis MB4]NNG67084.1 PhzF family phenazine biosynthesis protein [Caldanaerobacter subterraneus]
MKIFIVDAFTEKPFSGNPAGVVVLENGEKIDETFMQNLAAELKHSETAFIEVVGEKDFKVRFFTPTSEVDLCGHATIASFTVLKRLGFVKAGDVVTMHSLAGKLPIYIEEDKIMMEQAAPQAGEKLNEDDLSKLAKALNISVEEIGDKNYDLVPQLVSTGLWDILVPVKSRETLFSINPDYQAISQITKEKNAVSLHVFTLEEKKAIANCRDFAPLYGINEEAATGTANGALTYYLYLNKVIDLEKTYLIHQGESMKRPSKIYVKLPKKEEGIRVLVGGPARILISGNWSD